MYCIDIDRENAFKLLNCIALQISKALAGTDRKDLMRKLPKFIYDEEKALEVRIQSCIDHSFSEQTLFTHVAFVCVKPVFWDA